MMEPTEFLMEISALSDVYKEATLDSWGKILQEIIPEHKQNLREKVKDLMKCSPAFTTLRIMTISYAKTLLSIHISYY